MYRGYDRDNDSFYWVFNVLHRATLPCDGGSVNGGGGGDGAVASASTIAVVVLVLVAGAVAGAVRGGGGERPRYRGVQFNGITSFLH